MQREEKSERSRRAVLDAALYLFSHQGYRATTMRQIADRVICVATPEPFDAVGVWYRDFEQISDEEVVRLLATGAGGISPDSPNGPVER